MSLASRLALVGNFIGARGLQFVAPVAAANLLTTATYGSVEWAHAAATLASTVLVLGLNALVPFVVLRDDARGSLVAAQVHGAVLAGACLTASFVAALFAGSGSPHVVALLFTGTLVMQGLWTYLLRSRGSDAASLYLEASPFVIVALAAAAAAWANLHEPLIAISGVLALMCAILLAATLKECVWALRHGHPLLYRESVEAGVPLMLGSLVTMLATTSGRLGIGLLGGSEHTGTFAAIARIAALPVIAHQLAVVSSFRDLYSVDSGRLQRLALVVLALVSASVVALLALQPLIEPLLGAAFAAAAAAHPVACVLLVAQVTLWSGIALNDLVAARHGVLSSVLPWSAAALLSSLAIAGIELTASGVSVERFAVWHTAVMAALFIAQCCAMACLGVRFAKYWCACLVSFSVITAAALHLRGLL